MRRNLKILLIIVCLVVTLAPPTSAAATTAVENLGPVPLTATTTAGGQTVVMPDGRVRIWTVVSGKPAYLAEIDPFTASVVRTYPLGPNAQGAWGVQVADDGTVWVASYGRGELFRLRPGASSTDNLGAPNAVTSFLWAVDVSSNGDPCVGNYEALATGGLPPAHLFCYRQATSNWQDYGTFADDATLVRSVAIVGDDAYVGTGPVTPRLWRVNLTTGAKTELSIPAGVPRKAGYTYEMDVVNDRYLFVRFFVAGSYGQMLDTRTGMWASLQAWAGQTVSAADDDGWLYLVGAGSLMRFNIHTHRMVPVTNAAFLGSRGVELVRRKLPEGNQRLVVALGSDGRLWSYDFGSGIVKQVDVSGLTGTPTTPRAHALGPEGDVYVGGYFSGGLARLDPGTGRWTFNRFRQIEGMVAHGDKMYLGTYTGADLWEFDPRQEFVEGTNPRKVATLSDAGQERPFAMAATTTHVVMGTQPKNGLAGGGIGVYQPSTSSFRSYLNPAGDNQIDALTSDGQVVYGGSSAYSTLGQLPGSATVFAMDPETGQVRWSVEPMPGEKGIGGLTMDSDGDVWGVTAGSIFELDATTGAVKRTKVIKAYDWSKTLSFNPLAHKIRYDSGQDELHVSAAGTIHSLDEATLTDSAPTGLAGAQIVDHPDGTSYWLAGQNLYRAVL